MDVAGLLGATYLGGQVSAPVATSRREGEGRRVETTRPGRLQSHQGAHHRRREARAPAAGAVREVVDGRETSHVFIVRRRVVIRKSAPKTIGDDYAGTRGAKTSNEFA